MIKLLNNWFPGKTAASAAAFLTLCLFGLLTVGFAVNTALTNEYASTSEVLCTAATGVLFAV